MGNSLMNPVRLLCFFLLLLAGGAEPIGKDIRPPRSETQDLNLDENGSNRTGIQHPLPGWNDSDGLRHFGKWHTGYPGQEEKVFTVQFLRGFEQSAGLPHQGARIIHILAYVDEALNSILPPGQRLWMQPASGLPGLKGVVI